MRNDNMGRKRKDLIDKSTTVFFRLENKIVFKLLDENNINYDPNAEIFTKELLKELNGIVKDSFNID